MHSYVLWDWTPEANESIQIWAEKSMESCKSLLILREILWFFKFYSIASENFGIIWKYAFVGFSGAESHELRINNLEHHEGSKFS